MATLGRTLGYLGLAFGVLFIAGSIVVPRFVSSSRRTANQFSTRASLREINAAAATYATTYGHGFPATLAALGTQQSENTNAPVEPSEKAAGLIGEYLAEGRKSFYRFTYLPGPTDSTGRIQSYAVHADPVDSFEAGNIYYFTDQTSVIRIQKGREANQDSPPIE
jgi:type II secretory pathway pseudopilin PulG